MKKHAAAGLLLMAAVPSAYADFIGIYAGAGYWNADFSGNVIDGVSVDSDLNIDSDAGNYIYAAFEHPIPFVPNIRLARTGISDTGTGTLNSSFVFNGTTFTVDQTVRTEIDLTHTDLTLYYELIDTGMDVDLGLTARYLQGEVSVD
ncbi:MAG: TIGR04219 family outer membrane beta-barrel protein, partial [Pseudomonadales bacterium]|nr:TIGR04219 family outer membrane beta-barrel protein [Pseudomonadales bacterium]